MSDKKPFAETKFGKFLNEKLKPVAGDVLEVVGGLTGVEAIERVGEFLNDKKDESKAMNDLNLEFEKYKLDMKLELHRLEIQADLDGYKAEVEDRVSARVREAEWTKATGKRDWIMGAVIITGLVLLVGSIATIVFVQIPAENQRLADMCFGAVMSIGASIFSYYVGSSRSSSIKDQHLKEIYAQSQN